MKNLIISILLVYIFSQPSGWKCSGLEKFFICAGLTACTTLIISNIDYLIKKHYNNI